MQLLALIDFSSLNYALASSRNASAKSMEIERGFTITLIDEPIEIGFPFDLPSREPNDHAFQAFQLRSWRPRSLDVLQLDK